MSSAHLGGSAVHPDCLLQLGSALLGKHIQAESILCHVHRQIREDKLLLFNYFCYVDYLSLLFISVALSSLSIVTSVSRVLFLPNQRKAQQEDGVPRGPTAHRVQATWSHARQEPSAPQMVT